MKTELTKEQSAHLTELGVSFCKASKHNCSGNTIFKLTDLLKILPNFIYRHDGFSNRQYLRYIRWSGGWHQAYYHCSETLYTLNPICSAEELIDALYELTVWCIKNGHLKFD